MHTHMRGQRGTALVTNAGGWGAGLCLAGIVVAGALQVFWRYALNAPLSWPEEVSRLLLIWLTYIGALVAPQSRLHVSVDVVYNRLSPSARRAADLVGDLLGAGFFGALLVGGLELTYTTAGIRLPALQLPLNLIFGLMPVVGAIQLHLHVASAIHRFRDRAGMTPAP